MAFAMSSMSFREPSSRLWKNQTASEQRRSFSGHSLTDPRSNAYGSMTGGDFQDWQLGVELTIPLGFRREMAGVRHAQLSLARDRAILQDQELELSHQLIHAIRKL